MAGQRLPPIEPVAVPVLGVPGHAPPEEENDGSRNRVLKQCVVGWRHSNQIVEEPEANSNDGRDSTPDEWVCLLHCIAAAGLVAAPRTLAIILSSDLQ